MGVFTAVFVMKIVSNKIKGLSMRAICFLFSLGLLLLFLNTQAPPVLGNRSPSPPKRGPVVVPQIQYIGTLAETKTSFVAVLSPECTNQMETVLPLSTGDLAVTGCKLPEEMRLDRSGNGYLLTVTSFATLTPNSRLLFTRGAGILCS